VELKEIREHMRKMEDALTEVVRNYEEKTDTYVHDIYVRRTAGKPWQVKVRTIVSVDDPTDYITI
jgi:hypothetical protein